MNPSESAELFAILRHLMTAETLGDIHEGGIDPLCDLLHIKRPEGDFVEGWTDEDYARAGFEPGEKEEDEEP